MMHLCAVASKQNMFRGPVFAPSLVSSLRFISSKKRQMPSAKFPEHAQKWRDNWRKERQRLLADSLRSYVSFSSTKRQPPWDARFAPFDRQEKDGVYLVMRHLMSDKLAATNNHAAPVKRLFCNVGVVGPTVTTQMRWKPRGVAQLSATATQQTAIYSRDKTVRSGGFND